MERTLIENIPLPNHHRLKAWIEDNQVVFTVTPSRGREEDLARIDATTAMALMQIVRIGAAARG